MGAIFFLNGAVKSYDIFESLAYKAPQANFSEKFSMPNILNNLELLNLIFSLNQDQTIFLMNLMMKVKLINQPYYTFISGQAGVGKSLL